MTKSPVKTIDSQSTTKQLAAITTESAERTTESELTTESSVNMTELVLSTEAPSTTKSGIKMTESNSTAKRSELTAIWNQLVHY